MAGALAVTIDDEVLFDKLALERGMFEAVIWLLLAGLF